MSAQDFQDDTETMRRSAQGLRTFDIDYAKLDCEWRVLADKVRRDQQYGPAEVADLARLLDLTDQITANLKEGVRLVLGLRALVEAAERHG
ncbi:hypothetical protein [Sphingomonas sp. Mn802worker]|uniref:hypothetical protein n=1 Tax=Sphingomonas sp. Mn802worker TaxID=629773 RepID=UPI0003691266|nr:hypothetical protein [Sphingomonas sp. Mn802worker]